MKLVNTNSLSAMEPLKELIHKVNGEKTDEQLTMYLAINLGTSVFDSWIMYDKDQPVGMITVEMVNMHRNPSAFIPYIWGDKEIRDVLFERAEKWARSKNLSKMIIYSNRHYKKYQDYGFELKRTVLEKEL